MSDELLPAATREIARKRKELAPETMAKFTEFSKQVFAEGALDSKTKQLIAVAVAHTTQCPYCITGHTKAARKSGATPRSEERRVGKEWRSRSATSQLKVKKQFHGIEHTSCTAW